jgi:hypothetical protein
VDQPPPRFSQALGRHDALLPICGLWISVLVQGRRRIPRWVNETLVTAEASGILL